MKMFLEDKLEQTVLSGCWASFYLHPACSSDLSILLTSYSSIRRFVDERAVRSGCLAARGVFCPSRIGLGRFYCSHFHFIHMKEFCILMKVETSHYVCLCACSTHRGGGRAAGWCVQVSLNRPFKKTAPCTRLWLQADVAAFYRPVLLRFS